MRVQPTACWVGVVALAIILRVPFFLTHHVQEDAFITFRTAVNLVEHGEYSYNLGLGTPGASSYAYGFLVALIRGAFGAKYFLHSMCATNTLLLLLANHLFIKFASRYIPIANTVGYWFALSLTPPALSVSYLGMETALLIFVVASLLVSVALRSSVTGVLFAIAPLVRPDSFLYTIALLGLCWVPMPGMSPVKDRSFRMGAVSGFVLGHLFLVGLNYHYFGMPVNLTAAAKAIHYHPSFTPSAVMRRIYTFFLGADAFLAPVPTKHLGLLNPALVIVMMAILFTSYRRRTGLSWQLRAGVLWMLLVVPAAYVIAGVVFSWYLEPSAWLGYSLLVGLAFHARKHNVGAFIPRVTFAALLLAAGAKWVVSVNTGLQESRYRAGIGKFIRENARKGDTVFLEPAGYIPYFAELESHDVVGLVSREVFELQKTRPSDWWPWFVMQKSPTFIVDRWSLFEAGAPAPYGFMRTLTEDEKITLNREYELIRQFRYDPAEHWRGAGLFLPVLRLGTASSYFVYRRRTANASGGR